MTGHPPFPSSVGQLNAPPSWRCIDFISDIHLDASLPSTTAILKQYLENTPADAVLILGDLFEAWVGDDLRTAPYESMCTAMLSSAGTRLHLGIMVGNRDFLLGADMIAACHAHALTDPTVLTAWNQRILLMHGDALCLDDAPYLRFRQEVRNPQWQQRFLAQPLTARMAIAKQMRDASAAHQRGHSPMDWTDLDSMAAATWMNACHADLLIHGHTHHPSTEPFGPGRRMVLSDWDADHTTPHRAQVLRLHASGADRINLI